MKLRVKTQHTSKAVGFITISSCGRKVFQSSLKDGIELLNTIQDVYLEPSIRNAYFVRECYGVLSRDLEGGGTSEVGCIFLR
jgi:hypothetical protein